MPKYDHSQHACGYVVTVSTGSLYCKITSHFSNFLVHSLFETASKHSGRKLNDPENDSQKGKINTNIHCTRLICPRVIFTCSRN